MQFAPQLINYVTSKLNYNVSLSEEYWQFHLGLPKMPRHQKVAYEASPVVSFDESTLFSGRLLAMRPQDTGLRKITSEQQRGTLLGELRVGSLQG